MNQDFVDQLASLTPYNASPAAKERGLLTKAGVSEGMDVTSKVGNSHTDFITTYVHTYIYTFTQRNHNLHNSPHCYFLNVSLHEIFK